jgi:hypothetical protein
VILRARPQRPANLTASSRAYALQKLVTVPVFGQKVALRVAPKLIRMERSLTMSPRVSRIAGLGFVIVAIWIAAIAALVGGCAPALPSEKDLRAALMPIVKQDVREYNQIMDRWTPPNPEIDGSSFSMTRSRQELAPDAEVTITRTKGHTTVFEATVPITIETTIKTGLTEDECLAAPERELGPQQITAKYEWDTVRNKWTKVKFGAPGGLIGM